MKLSVNPVNRYREGNFLPVQIGNPVIIREGNLNIKGLSDLMTFYLILKAVDIGAGPEGQIGSCSVCAPAVKGLTVQISRVVDVNGIPFLHDGSFCRVQSCL